MPCKQSGLILTIINQQHAVCRSCLLICAMILGETFRHDVTVFVCIMIFVISGLLGELDLAAQHILDEIGTIVYMV